MRTLHQKRGIEREHTGDDSGGLALDDHPDIHTYSPLNGHPRKTAYNLQLGFRFSSFIENCPKSPLVMFYSYNKSKGIT